MNILLVNNNIIYLSQTGRTFVAERTLEDHEDILAVHRELEMFASRYERRFYFSQDFLKYEVFIKPMVSEKIEIFVIPLGRDCFFNYPFLKSTCQNFRKIIKFLRSSLLFTTANSKILFNPSALTYRLTELYQLDYRCSHAFEHMLPMRYYSRLPTLGKFSPFLVLPTNF